MFAKSVALVLAFATLTIGACAPASGPSATAPALQATTLDEKGLYAAEALYNVPAQAFLAADAAGKLSPERKAKLKPLLADAYKALLGLRMAYALGNAADFNAKLAALTTLSERLNHEL